MATYTITTTDEQEKGLTYAYEQSVKVIPAPPAEPPPPLTQAEYLQQQVDNAVLNPMMQHYLTAAGQLLASSFATVPPENRAAAVEDIKLAITDNGGTVTEVPPVQTVRWMPPPPAIIPPLR